MKLREFALLADENIDFAVVEWLRNAGFDVQDIVAAGLQGASDVEIIRRAVVDNRLVVTHDSDFGTLAILGSEPIIGLVFLRPGHIDASFTTQTIERLLAVDPDVTPPFIVVARRTRDDVAIRIRHL